MRKDKIYARFDEVEQLLHKFIRKVDRKYPYFVKHDQMKFIIVRNAYFLDRSLKDFRNLCQRF